jgi:hypothetical protein
LTASRHRTLLGIVFALLLLGMQREVQVHALQHLGRSLHPAQEQGVQALAADTACLECSLLAGGSSVVPAAFPASPSAAAATLRAIRAVASRSLPAPSYYSSRAPPTPL